MSGALNNTTDRGSHPGHPHTRPAAELVSRRGGWAGMRLSLIRFSPLDLRIILRVLLFLLTWKILSSDYSALPALIQGPDINPIFPLWMNPWIDSIQTWLFDQSWKVVSLQIVAAGSLLLTAWRPNRLALLPGVLILWALQLSSAQYRFISFDYETPLSLLVILMAWPRSWKGVLHGGTEITSAATTLGTCLAVYVAIMYHMTGLSKIYFDPYWSENVRLDMLIPAMNVWHGTILPGWLKPTATFERWMFTSVPYLSAMIATVTLSLETFWPLVIVSKWCRRVIPLSMFCAHMAIFLGSGILFLSMAVSAISVVIPWRYLVAPMTLYFDPASARARWVAAIVGRFNWSRRLSVCPMTHDSHSESTAPGPVAAEHGLVAVDDYGQYAGATAVSRAMLRCGLLVPLGVVGLLPIGRGLARAAYALLFRSAGAVGEGAPRHRSRAAQYDRLDATPPRRSPIQSAGYVTAVVAVAYLGFFPSMLNTYFYPFINYRVFGWSYAAAAQPTTIYRLGYWNRQDKRVEFVPMNHGGFMDFNMVSCPGVDIKGFLDSTTDEQRAYHAKRLRQYQKALRPHGSNRWLLGPLAHPNHVIAKSDSIPTEWFDKLYLMEGHSRYLDGDVHIGWTVRGRLPADDAPRAATDRVAGKSVLKK